MVLFSLLNISGQLSGGTPLSPPRSPRGYSAFGLCNSASTYQRELRKIMSWSVPVTQFVGMTGHPASFHDLLCDEDPLSEASSTECYVPYDPPLRKECTMMGVHEEPPPEAVESQATHTPQDL